MIPKIVKTVSVDPNSNTAIKVVKGHGAIHIDQAQLDCH